MPDDQTPTLLDHVYTSLALDAGALLPTSSSPSALADPTEWRAYGDWLLLGERLGADRIFFLGDDPVLVFSRLPGNASESEIMDLYRRAWSMARPRCLFVDAGDVLRVYSLDAPPPAPGEQAITPIEVVDRAADVQHQLARFHRDRFESGAALEDAALAPSAGRADKRLLRDVKVATTALRDAGLEARQAHALIERAILVRYLEDREVLTDRYFDEVAEQHPISAAAIEALDHTIDFGAPSRFIDFLSDAQLTKALFARLAVDFNGDLFVPSEDEATPTTAHHLRLLRDLLRGAGSEGQEPLFLWAYDFSVVPTSLVSTMYELFYNEEAEGQTSSTYYTPPELVEFVLGDVMSPELLDRKAITCDPACGSGIFLVEAYRRIVRHEAAKAGKRLTSRSLRRLLLERIAGCDIDESAIRLAAFSLYVAYLNYQTPSDIQKAGQLPPLIHRLDDGGAPAPLVVADAFSPLIGEGIDEGDPAGESVLPWRLESFDIVIGNPPWTEPKGGPPSSGERWARRRGLPVGDRSPSQLFLWRSLDLVKPSGVAAMLVSAKVLFNTRTTSQAFRRSWLASVRLGRVVNFSEIRRDFFERAIAPFALIRFERSTDALVEPLIYETARPVPAGRRGSAALARLDRRLVEQGSLLNNDFLWKTYSAGDHRDEAFIGRLGLEKRLGDLRPVAPKAQYGYQRSSPGDRNGHPTPASWRDIRSLGSFESWGPLREEWFEDVPRFVKFDPAPDLFLNRTLAVRRGVTPTFGAHARLLSEPLAFRHTVYGIPLGHRHEWEAKVALGTVLSALGRYWLFMVSGSWGTWKDEIRAEQLLKLPVRLDAEHKATDRIVAAVNRFDHVTQASERQLDAMPDDDNLGDVLGDLDAAVGDLFELTQAERDLVDDFWAARQKDASDPVNLSPGATANDTTESGEMVTDYASAFRRVWRPMLSETVELNAQFGQDSQARVITAVFEPHETTGLESTEVLQAADWASVLGRYADSLDERTTNRLRSYGELRAVSDTAIVIVKRNERRLWSPTAARRDAEATAAQLLALREQAE